MTYRSILTYIDGQTPPDKCLDAAIAVTRQMDAHLSVVAFGYEPNVPVYAYGDPGIGVSEVLYAQAREEVAKNTKVAQHALQQAGVLGEVVPALCLVGGMARTFGDHAQFSDLVILPRPYSENTSHSAIDAFEGALFDAGATVLVCPEGTAHIDLNTVMIAWNGSREALQAVRKSLPLLKKAKTVEIVLVDTMTNQPDPGERLAVMLSRHDISVDIVTQPHSPEAVSKTLMRRAGEMQAGLLVMGGYGHSRFREYLVGGVTRDLLGNTNIPVLLAH